MTSSLLVCITICIVNISLVLGGPGFMLVSVWISPMAHDVELTHLPCIFPIGVGICSKSLSTLQGKLFYFKNDTYLLIVCLRVGWHTCHSACGTWRIGSLFPSWGLNSDCLTVRLGDKCPYSLSCLIGLGSFYTVGNLRSCILDTSQIRDLQMLSLSPIQSSVPFLKSVFKLPCGLGIDLDGSSDASWWLKLIFSITYSVSAPNFEDFSLISSTYQSQFSLLIIYYRWYMDCGCALRSLPD